MARMRRGLSLLANPDSLAVAARCSNHERLGGKGTAALPEGRNP